jgi:hypothetical protein
LDLGLEDNIMGQDMGMGYQNPSALFQQERMWEQKVANRILSNMRAAMVIRRGVDPQLDGLYNQIPPPPELTEAKVWLRYRMAIAKSGELKRVIAMILRFIIKPLLDLFKKDPILVPSYWKEEATTPSEREYIFAPEQMVPPKETFEDDMIAEYGDIELEDSHEFTDDVGDLYDRARQSFIGPSGYKKSEGAEEEEEGEGLDL